MIMSIMGSKLSPSLSVFLAIASLFSTLCCASDTIATSQTIRDIDNITLLSSNGNFELGFFSPGNSKNRYVGIWYKKISNRTVVWVANRDSPLTDKSGELKLIQPGMLVLLNATNGTIIWSTNTSTSVKSPVAQLLNTGNLVVRDADEDNSENFLWQSFNYPTDTFLPGMKLGKDLVTGQEIYITSSKSDSDLSTGDCSFYSDPTGYPQNVIRKGDAVKYRSGPWNGKGFSGRPNLQKNGLFTFGMVVNEKEVFYSYDMVNDSLYMRFTVSNNGYGYRLLWVERTQEWNTYIVVPGDNCDIYNECGPYGSCNIKNSPSCGCLDKFKPNDPQGWESGDWSGGCNRSTPLNCEKGDGFVKYSGLKLPDTRSSRYNKSMNLDECREVCLRDCSCMAYSSLDISKGENGCLLWFGDLIDIREISLGQDIFIRMASSESGSNGTKPGSNETKPGTNEMKPVSNGKKPGSNGKRRRIFVLVLSLAFVTLLLCLGLLLYLQKKKKVEHQQPDQSGRQRFSYLDIHPDQSHADLELPLFDLSKLIKATDNFSIHNKLGEGGFGSVYLGQLEDGQVIAVKRLSTTSVQGMDEFKNEVICIKKLQHRNLVKLLGCCIEGEEKMLVYEYLTNRSLDLILFDPLRSILLDWPRRFNILNGVARGLMYLHQDSRLRVIHRDLKTSNILLDANMNPKISDFGIARIFGGNQTGGNTSRVVGTYGYMAPEYAMDGLFSVKSDVYSFGVVVLEIVSGKRNRGIFRRDKRLNLLGHAWMLYREGRSLELLDPRVRETCHLSEVARSIHIGLLCVQEEPEERPSMSSVVVMLSNDGVLPEAKRPGFFKRREALHYETPFFTNTSSSSNTMTITEPEPR